MSYKTAITRNKPSKPMKYLDENGFLNNPFCVFDINQLDFGCGKGFDADHFKMDKYDPHFNPEFPTKLYDVITCNYVLNVIPDQFTRDQVLRDIQSLLKPDGRAFITVRRDVKHDTDTQFRVCLDHLAIVYQDGSCCIYGLDKNTKLKEIEHEEIRA
jgi:ATP adenylyltransferase